MRIFYSILLVFLLFSCDSFCPKDYHKYLTLKNNSSKTIRFLTFSSDSVFKINGALPPINSSPHTLEPYASFEYIHLGCGWEEDVSSGYMLYYNQDTIEAIGWEAIDGTNRGLLKRVYVDREYLEQHDFTINYP